MPYLKCLVFGCSNTSQFNKLYAFPKNLQLAKEWLNLCGQPRASNNRTRRICSLHFADNDFEEDSSKSGSSLGKVLKKNAVPTLLLPDKTPFVSTEKRKMEEVEDSIVADKKIKVEPVDVEVESVEVKVESVEVKVESVEVKVEPVDIEVESVEDVHAAVAPSMTSVNQQKEMSLNVNYTENMPKVSFIGPQQSSYVDGNFEATFPMVSPPPVQASSGSKAPPIRYQVSANQPKPSTSRVSSSVNPPAAVVSTSTAVAKEEAIAREVSSLSNAIVSLSNATSSITQTYDNPSYCCLEASVMKIEGQLSSIYGMIHSLNNWRHEEQNKKVSGLKQEKK